MSQLSSPAPALPRPLLNKKKKTKYRISTSCYTIRCASTPVVAPDITRLLDVTTIQPTPYHPPQLQPMPHPPSLLHPTPNSQRHSPPPSCHTRVATPHRLTTTNATPLHATPPHAPPPGAKQPPAHQYTPHHRAPTHPMPHLAAPLLPANHPAPHHQARRNCTRLTPHCAT